jgi:hypothetical protein
MPQLLPPACLPRAISVPSPLKAHPQLVIHNAAAVAACRRAAADDVHALIDDADVFPSLNSERAFSRFSFIRTDDDHVLSVRVDESAFHIQPLLSVLFDHVLVVLFLKSNVELRIMLSLVYVSLLPYTARLLSYAPVRGVSALFPSVGAMFSA